MTILLAFAQKYGGYIFLIIVICGLMAVNAFQNVTIKNLRVDVRELKLDVEEAQEINKKQANLILLLTASKEHAERTAAEIAKRATNSKKQADTKFKELQKRIEDAKTDEDMLPITPAMRAVLDGMSTSKPLDSKGTTTR